MFIHFNPFKKILLHFRKQVKLTSVILIKGRTIDTLYLSPLLFPNKPYHRLLKDDELQTDEMNYPLNDAIRAKELFYDEVTACYITNRRRQIAAFSDTCTILPLLSMPPKGRFLIAIAHMLCIQPYLFRCDTATVYGQKLHNRVRLGMAVAQ